MDRHAAVERSVLGACQQQHLPAREAAERFVHGLRHGKVARDLDANHGRLLRLRQQTAVTAADGLGDALTLRLLEPRIEAVIGCGLDESGPRQVATQHRHARTHRRHDDRAVHLPRPAGPGQRRLYADILRIERLPETAAALFRHLDHHRAELPLGGQQSHRVGHLTLLIGLVVLLAEDQHLRRGIGRRRNTTCQASRRDPQGGWSQCGV